MTPNDTVAAVAIGRNEGERLVQCLSSLTRQIPTVVYVDSGSTDDSIANAKAAGTHVLDLDLSQPFTAARARNAGRARLADIAPGIEFVQFIDGDCELQEGWIKAGLAAFAEDDRLAVVFGRRREKFREASLWNRLIDQEWDGPAGEALACGGDSLIRVEALDAVEGYREDLIAGEEPEMCYRMRQLGWRIRRLDHEMTLHDAALTRVSQWWQRCRRCGHAYAEGATLHGVEPERYRVRQTLRSLFWGAGVPLAAIFGAFFTPWAMLILLIWPLQMVRLTLKGYERSRAVFLTLGMVPEAQGAIGYFLSRLRGRKRVLIEYK